MASQIAPIADRIGRLMVDIAPHFARVAYPNYYSDSQDALDEAMDAQVPIMPNNSDVSIVNNIINRYILGDNPNIEIHMHTMERSQQRMERNQEEQNVSQAIVIPPMANVNEQNETERVKLSIQTLQTFSYSPIKIIKKAIVYKKPIKENNVNAINIKKAVSPKLSKTKIPTYHKIIRGNSIDQNSKSIIMKKASDD